MKRREYLELSGAGAAALATVGLGQKLSAVSTAPAIVEEGGPQNPDRWELRFEDTFASGSLDRASWNIGWGWGRTTTTSPMVVTDSNVFVSQEQLHLQGTHNCKNVWSGVVNTKDTVTFGPESYIEAKLKFARRVGFLNAFWTKPNDEEWPPEIDVVELIQRGDKRTESHVSTHNLHYSASTKPGDSSTYRRIGGEYEPEGELTEEFNIYGVEWRADTLIHYVNGQAIIKWVNETMLEAMREGAPFYLLLSLNIDHVGTADRSESWGEALVCDWVRVWDRSPEMNESAGSQN